MKKCGKCLWVVALVMLTLGLYPVLEVQAQEVATETLTPNYFLSTPGKTFVYQFQYTDDGTTGQKLAVWEQDETGVYTNTMVFEDGSCDFERYILENNEVVQIDSGFSVPRSEWSDDPVILGKNVVFKNLAHGSSWTNQYQTKDGWETVCSYNAKHTFVGFENIEVMGTEVRAAMFNCIEEKKVIEEAPMGAEWGQVPYNSNYNQWFVEGIGLVKSSYYIDNPYIEEPYFINSELTNIIDVAITPNDAVDMVCQQLGLTSQSVAYACQEPSEDGLYVVSVEVPYGYTKSSICGKYYVSPWNGAISRNKAELLTMN